MSDELKPCPLCGKSAKVFSIYFNGKELFSVQCDNGVRCAELDVMSDAEAEAIAAWNTRPIEDTLRKQIDELEKDLKEACHFLSLSNEFIRYDEVIEAHEYFIQRMNTKYDKGDL